MFVLAAGVARIKARGYASITGTVADPTGAVVPAASVTAVETQTGRVFTVKSSADGTFVNPTLLPSNYAITVTAPGFRSTPRREWSCRLIRLSL